MAKNMIELKLCPFCGAKADLMVTNGVRVRCPRCGISTESEVDYEPIDSKCAIEKVVEKWNSRV